jgi:hypothetical protein
VNLSPPQQTGLKQAYTLLAAIVARLDTEQEERKDRLREVVIPVNLERERAWRDCDRMRNQRHNWPEAQRERLAG